MTSADIPAAALPWRLMVRPVAGWHEIGGRQVLFHALAWQWLLLSLAELIASPVMLQISGATPEGNAGWLKPLGIVIGFLPLVLFLNAAFAALCWLFFRIIGLPRSYAEFLHWSAFGLLAFVLGTLLGRLCLELLHPASLHHALLAPLQFRGISIGLASWFPSLLQPLEFSWVALSFLDFFGLWSILLLALGLRHYLKASRHESVISSVALVMLCFALLTGIWQLFQRLAGPA